MTNKDDIKDNNIILKPLRWRWFFYHWGVNSLAILIGIGIFTLVKESLFTSSFLGFFIGVTIVTFWFSWYTDNWKIIISDNDIKGGWKKGKRIIIPLAEIDRTRSFKKTALRKLLGIDYIFSTTGQKIYVESITLGEDQVGQLRAKLNV